MTCFLWSLSEWSLSYLLTRGITHNINTVTTNSVLMCDWLFYQKLQTKELRISNISESLLLGSSVSIYLPLHCQCLINSIPFEMTSQVLGIVIFIKIREWFYYVDLCNFEIVVNLVHTCVVTIYNTEYLKTRGK